MAADSLRSDVAFCALLILRPSRRLKYAATVRPCRGTRGGRAPCGDGVLQAGRDAGQFGHQLGGDFLQRV